MRSPAAPTPAAGVSSYNPTGRHRFDIGDLVRVKALMRPGHCRTPAYIRGKRGVVERICGAYRNPEELAYGFDGEPARVLYRVRFGQREVWPHYVGGANDAIELEIYEHWLEKVEGGTAT